MIAWLAGIALAAPCPDTSDLVEQARSAFDDAEAEHAAELLEQAELSLSCQGAPVLTSELVDLRYFDAMVWISLRDEDKAALSIRRALVTDPDAPPASQFGPEVARSYDAARVTMPSERVRVFLEGDSSAWVDGRSLSTTEPLRVVPGEHLLQWRAGGSFHSQKVSILTDHRVLAGPLLGEVVETEERVPVRKPKRKHKLRPVGIALAGATTAVGAAVLGIGGVQEMDFKKDPYSAQSYGRCSLGETCYDSERQAAIQKDAGRIRATYVTGYVITAGGLAFSAAELLVIPRLTGGAELRYQVRW